MRRLAELPIKPLRIAFDHIKLKDRYIEKIEWAVEFGLTRLSNYILYNYDDRPEDLYERLRINVELNERLGTQIFSFPMKYIPVTDKDRKFVDDKDKHWNPRYLRSIQCILHVTHGVVGPKRKFFEAAFGKNLREFKKLLLMPDNYIIYREDHKYNGAADWKKSYSTLSFKQKEEFHNIIYKNQLNNGAHSKYTKVNALLLHYRKGSSNFSEQKKGGTCF